MTWFKSGHVIICAGREINLAGRLFPLIWEYFLVSDLLGFRAGFYVCTILDLRLWRRSLENRRHKTYFYGTILLGDLGSSLRLMHEDLVCISLRP